MVTLTLGSASFDLSYNFDDRGVQTVTGFTPATADGEYEFWLYIAENGFDWRIKTGASDVTGHMGALGYRRTAVLFDVYAPSTTVTVSALDVFFEDYAPACGSLTGSTFTPNSVAYKGCRCSN